MKNSVEINSSQAAERPIASFSSNPFDCSLTFALDFKQSGESAFRAFEMLRDNDFAVRHPVQDANGWHLAITLQLFDDHELVEQMERLDGIASQFDAQFCTSASDQLRRHAAIIDMEKAAARMAFSNGLFEKCIRKVEQLLVRNRIDPIEGLGMIGKAKFELGKYDEAKQVLQNHLTNCLDARTRGISQNYLALCFVFENDYERAEEIWIEALATPSIDFAHYGLARCRARSGQPRQALHWLKLACSTMPQLRDNARVEPDFGRFANTPEFRRIVSPSWLDRMKQSLCDAVRNILRNPLNR